MKHDESNLQQQCVAWFRAEYPQFAMLLVHPINEGSGHTEMDRRRQGIHKAEGAVAGVPDLLFFLPSFSHLKSEILKSFWVEVNGLGIEFKTERGKQSPEQKKFQRYFEAAGYGYHIVRSIEEFKVLIISYINMAHEVVKDGIKLKHIEITMEAEAKQKAHFYKVLKK